MSTPAITTVVKMLETLPESMQERVADHLREYIADLEDERQWDEQFRKTQPQLLEAARRARQEVKEGKVQPLGLDELRKQLRHCG